jgi:hypothetical protein
LAGDIQIGVAAGVVSYNVIGGLSDFVGKVEWVGEQPWLWREGVVGSSGCFNLS